MNENDFFNKDAMYWREVNATSPGMLAEIELIEELEVGGEWLSKIGCALLPFESAEVVYEMENGGAFKKNEVISWPYVLLNNLAFYQDESNAEEERKAKALKIDHSKIQSITLKDENGTVLLTKAKI
mgnify:FL=1|tara:strand:+ start:3280 stop:3660 length:381 start_codon:yes stop_codon:yes gene_type:complete